MTTTLLPLAHLRTLRLAVKLKRSHLSAITGITDKRLTLIEKRKVEPWLDEAHLIACVLNLGGINPLVILPKAVKLSGSLTLSEQLALWRSGERIRLSTAYAITAASGRDDPFELVSSPVACEIWNVIEANDRHPTGRGYCPWCGADAYEGEAHAATCLPSFALARPATGPMNADRRLPSQDGNSTAMPGKALRTLRERAGLTQAEVADGAHMSPNYYARVERCEVGLTRANAERIGEVFRVDPAALYVEAADV